MFGRLVSGMQDHGIREGFRVWWNGSTRRECLTVLLLLNCFLFAAWAILVFWWMNELRGYEGVVSTDAVGWILILWLPVVNVTFLASQIPVLQRIWRRLVGVRTQLPSSQVRTRVSTVFWWLYWVLALCGCVYLTVGHRPWGLFAALFAFFVLLAAYLLFHVGENFGSGIPDDEILVKDRHHWLGYFAFGLRDLPGVLKVIGIAPVIWILLWPLSAYAHAGFLSVGILGRVLQFLHDLSSRGVYWLYGSPTLLYWLLFAVAGWRRHGTIINKNHVVIITFPFLNPFPGTGTAEIDIARIAKSSVKTIAGVCVKFDPGLTAGPDAVNTGYLTKRFLEAMWDEQHLVSNQQAVM